MPTLWSTVQCQKLKKNLNSQMVLTFFLIFLISSLIAFSIIFGWINPHEPINIVFFTNIKLINIVNGINIIYNNSINNNIDDISINKIIFNTINNNIDEISNIISNNTSKIIKTSTYTKTLETMKKTPPISTKKAKITTTETIGELYSWTFHLR